MLPLARMDAWLGYVSESDEEKHAQAEAEAAWLQEMAQTQTPHPSVLDASQRGRQCWGIGGRTCSGIFLVESVDGMLPSI